MLSFNSSKYIFTFVLTFLLLGCGEKPDNFAREPQTPHVDILTVSTTKIRLTTQLPARISALKEVEVRPQVGGIIKKRHFKEGMKVTEGQVLYTIDPTTYQASVNSYAAQLKKSIADKESSEKSFKRYKELLKKNLTSQSTYDDAYSTYQQAVADVEMYQAELDNAKIDLSYTQIKAPISGIIGLSEMSEGALVTADQSTYLTTIIQSDQVYVDMTQSSASLYIQQKEYQDSLDKEENSIPVKILLEDGTEYGETGYLAFSDAQVDETTGSITLRAIVDNPKHALLPGMYLRANIASPEEKDYIVLPQSVVIRSQSGVPYVYIVNDQNIIEKTTLTLGREVDNGWVVTSGLKVGDKVVTSNLAAISPGTSVIIDNENEDNVDSQQNEASSVNK